MPARALAIALLLLALGCGSAGTPAPPPDPGTSPDPGTPPGPFREGFEQGLAGWAQGFEVPADPNNPGQPVAWSIESSDEQAAAGTLSARYRIDGRQDDGTIWLLRSFAVTPGATHTVNLTIRYWSGAESFNQVAAVAAYAGASAPTTETQFDTSQALDLTAGWRAYPYKFSVQAGDDGRIWVAFGITVTWETWMTYYADEVSVEIL